MLQISGFIHILTNSPELRGKNLWHIMTMRLLKQERLAVRADSVTEPTLGDALQRKVLLPESSVELWL